MTIATQGVYWPFAYTRNTIKKAWKVTHFTFSSHIKRLYNLHKAIVFSSIVGAVKEKVEIAFVASLQQRCSVRRGPQQETMNSSPIQSCQLLHMEGPQ